MDLTHLYSKLNQMNNEDYIHNFLVYNASLVIAKVKPAVTIALSKNNFKLYNSFNCYGKDFLHLINLSFIVLRENSNCMILMIYDQNVLKNHLSNDNAKSFLINLGYPKATIIDEYLKTLKDRYEKYNCPHELGLFLGIPFQDVIDFMECNNRKCLLCGYWKVYNHATVNEAISKFDKYDQIKKFTLKNILKGTLSHNLVVNIRYCV